jgi:uncharacterized membrane protein
MIAKIWRYLTSNIGVYFALFVAIWLVAWVCNALYKTGFDLAKLEELAKFILGKYITDSGLNTKFGGKTDGNEPN